MTDDTISTGTRRLTLKEYIDLGRIEKGTIVEFSNGLQMIFQSNPKFTNKLEMKAHNLEKADHFPSDNPLKDEVIVLNPVY